MNNTVVSVFINNGKLLMDQRSKSRKAYRGFLMCPSGHIEKGESFIDALKREMKEELGIIVKKATYLFTLDDVDPFSKLNFRHNFIFVDSFEGKIVESNEAESLVWLSYRELKNRALAPIVSKLVNKLHKQDLL